MCFRVVGLLHKKILKRKFFHKEAAIGSMSSKPRASPPLLVQNSFDGEFLRRNILSYLPAEGTQHLLLPLSRIITSDLTAYSSCGDFKSLKSYKREMNSFPCCSYSTTQEQDQILQSEQKQKEEENLKLLNEIKISNPFEINVDSSFIDIRDKSYFNDRTEIIAYAIKNKKVLIFHPRRSGKSTSLDTIATFLEKPLNNDGKIDQIQYEQNKVLFFGGETSINGNENQRFDPLKIANIKIQGKSSQEWFGKYPSLRFNLSRLKNLPTIEAVEEVLIDEIKEQFEEHKYLLSSLDPSEQKIFNQVKNNQKPAFIFKMILYLCSRLYYHHKEQVGVFIDEFDNSFNHLLAKENPDYDLLQKTSELISSFLECLSKSTKKISPVKFVIVFGVYNNLIKEVSGPNNFISYSVAINTLQGYYGLSQEEVEKNVKFLLDPNQENYEKKLKLLLNRIEILFNGYAAGGKKYYNIWSVFNYLDSISVAYENNQKLSGVDFKFWGASISNTVIIRILRECKYPNLTYKLLRIGLGQSQHLLYENRIDLNTPIDQLSEEKLEKYASNILLNGGYITRDILNDQNFVIPNEEVRILFQSFIPEVVDSKDGKTSIRQCLSKAIRDHDKQKIQEALELYCLHFISCRKYEDLTHPEYGYSNALTGLLNDIPFYEYLTEQPAGKGYADIILKPLDNNHEMIIIELKALSSKKKRTQNNLENLAKEGISQIKNRKYPVYALKYENCKEKCVMIGIAFHKKSVAVELEFFELNQLKENDTSKTTNTSS